MITTAAATTIYEELWRREPQYSTRWTRPVRLCQHDIPRVAESMPIRREANYHNIVRDDKAGHTRMQKKSERRETRSKKKISIDREMLQARSPGYKVIHVKQLQIGRWKPRLRARWAVTIAIGPLTSAKRAGIALTRTTAGAATTRGRTRPDILARAMLSRIAGMRA